MSSIVHVDMAFTGSAVTLHAPDGQDYTIEDGGVRDSDPNIGVIRLKGTAMAGTTIKVTDSEGAVRNAGAITSSSESNKWAQDQKALEAKTRGGNMDEIFAFAHSIRLKWPNLLKKL